MQKSFLNFSLMPNLKQKELIKNILSKDYDCELTNGILSYKKDNKKHIVIISTNVEKVEQFYIINLISNLLEFNADCIDIICNERAKNLNLNIFENLKIQIINKQLLYVDYFKKYNIYPKEQNLKSNLTKVNMQDILKNFFSPEKAKGFFLCGLILIFSSIILPYHIYYLIFGSTLLLFSIICKLLKFKNY